MLMEKRQVIFDDPSQALVFRHAEKRRGAIAFDAEPRPHEDEISNMRAEGDYAFALGERRRQILPAFDGDFAPRAIRIGELEEAVGEATGEILLDAAREPMLCSHGIRAAE